MIRVLVVDDHPVYRDGLTIALESIPTLEVVGTADSGDAAMSAVAAATPDVILLDLHMAGTNGIDATRRILLDHPTVAILVLTMLEDDASLFAAMRAGARGYLLKGAGRAEIERAVAAVATGQVVFSAGVAERVLALFAGASTTPFPQLTDREREVLGLLAHGITNAEIARRLVVSAKTVRNHVSNIFTKLQVDGRAEAVARARDAGLGRPTA